MDCVVRRLSKILERERRPMAGDGVRGCLRHCIRGTFRGSEGGFDTLPAVMKLFTNRWVALGGWVHYLAFDLFTGAWIVSESQRDSLPWWRVLPALPLTFMFGPAGLLLFTILRGKAV